MQTWGRVFWQIPPREAYQAPDHRRGFVLLRDRGIAGDGKWHLGHLPEVLLFNLEADLGEQTNLAAGHPDLVARLHERMLTLDGEIAANARPQWRRSAATP